MLVIFLIFNLFNITQIIMGKKQKFGQAHQCGRRTVTHTPCGFCVGEDR
uniref:Uncharacterized protein n=1 Tax=Arundo donax TaxID=35708 RepID=A0A0A9ASV7_ARUDO